MTEPDLYVIQLWMAFTDPYEDTPAETIGPFYQMEADYICTLLTCAFRKIKLKREVPEWATT